MNAPNVEHEFIEQGLRRALDRNELRLHYQPKFDLKTGAITGAEALSRWLHPTRGTILPGQFIPIAEDSGLILPLGDWVFGEACRQARVWANAGLPAKTITVNVSGLQFHSGDFLDGLFAALSENGLEPGILELDLTESVLMSQPQRSAITLKILLREGVRVSVDDFGTGNSTLKSMEKLPLNSIKIDRSFVSQMFTVPDGTNMVKAFINMGRSLNLRVIAEGVETAEDLEFLWANDCDEAQGYFFSPPVVPDQMAQLLRPN